MFTQNQKFTPKRIGALNAIKRENRRSMVETALKVTGLVTAGYIACILILI